MVKFVHRLLDDESGAVTLEYVAVAVIAAALAMTALTTIRDRVITNGINVFSITASPAPPVTSP